jgi:hypothetical protein
VNKYITAVKKGKNSYFTPLSLILTTILLPVNRALAIQGEFGV